jgi:hypothetical protein
MPMLRRLESKPNAADFADHEYERIFLFVRRKLPKQRANFFTDAILAAGARYDRYQAAKSEWKSYSARRARLNRITKSSADLTNVLLKLDVLTRDDLAGRLNEGMHQSLINALLLLRKEALELTKEVQQNGRWRDLAEERWIFDDRRRNPSRGSGSSRCVRPDAAHFRLACRPILCSRSSP